MHYFGVFDPEQHAGTQIVSRIDHSEVSVFNGSLSQRKVCLRGLASTCCEISP